MKFKINEFRIDAAEPVEAPLDFATLCALLAAHQAETPTARLARDGAASTEHVDHANRAVAALRGAPGHEAAGSGGLGSFHAAAAAHFNKGSGNKNDLSIYPSTQNFLDGGTARTAAGKEFRSSDQV